MAWGRTQPACSSSNSSEPNQSDASWRFQLVYAKAAHAGAIRHVVCNDIAQCVASASDDATVIVVPYAVLLGSAEDGALPIVRLCGHTLPVTSISWSPNGASLLTASHDGTLLIHDVQGALAEAQEIAARSTGAASRSGGAAALKYRQAVRTLAHTTRVTIGFPITAMCIALDGTYAFVAGRRVARVDLSSGSRIAEPTVGVLAMASAAAAAGSKSSWFAAAAAATRTGGTIQSKSDTTDVVADHCKGAELLLWRPAGDDVVSSGGPCTEMDGASCTRVVLRELDAGRATLVATFTSMPSTSTVTVVTWTLRSGTEWGRNGVASIASAVDALMDDAWKRRLLAEDAAGSLDYSTSAAEREGQLQALSAASASSAASWTLGYATWRVPVLRPVAPPSGLRAIPGTISVMSAATGCSNTALSASTYTPAPPTQSSKLEEASLSTNTSSETAALEAQLAMWKRRVSTEEEACQALASKLQETITSMQAAAAEAKLAKKRPRGKGE